MEVYILISVTAQTADFCPEGEMSWHFFVLSAFRTRIRSSKSCGGFVTDYLSITELTSGRCGHLSAQLLCPSEPVKLNWNPAVLPLAKFNEIYKNISYFTQQWPYIGGVLKLPVGRKLWCTEPFYLWLMLCSLLLFPVLEITWIYS